MMQESLIVASPTAQRISNGERMRGVSTAYERARGESRHMSPEESDAAIRLCGLAQRM